jgi:hypothetical protein
MLSAVRELQDATWIVTLVHGTGGGTSPWTYRGSAFAKRLEAALPGTVLFERFGWSGRNLHSDRHAAADTLAAELASRIAAFPDARHVVIGHSHGGNVALGALNLVPTLQPLLHSVVCLSTPFFVPSPRDNGVLRSHLELVAGHAKPVVGFLSFVVGFAVAGGLTWYLCERVLGLLDAGPAGAGSVVVTMVASLLVSVALYTRVSGWLQKNVARRYALIVSGAEGRRGGLASELFASAVIQTPIYAVTAWGDEPHVGLKLTSGIATAPHFLLRLVSGTTGFGMLALFVFGWCVNPFVVADGPSAAPVTDGLVGIWVGALVIGILVCMLLAVVVPVWVMIFQGLWQGLSLGDAILMRVGVVRRPPVTPPAVFRVLGLRALLRTHGLRALWRHSIIYDDDTSIRELGSWLSASRAGRALDSGPTAPSPEFATKAAG